MAQAVLVSGPVKRGLGEARKPAENDPANPARSTSHRSSGEVGPPARIFWCAKYPEPTAALMCRRVYEHLVTGCVHESDAHCPACAVPHIEDLIFTLAGEPNSSARQRSGRERLDVDVPALLHGDQVIGPGNLDNVREQLRRPGEVHGKPEQVLGFWGAALASVLLWRSKP